MKKYILFCCYKRVKFIPCRPMFLPTLRALLFHVVFNFQKNCHQEFHPLSLFYELEKSEENGRAWYLCKYNIIRWCKIRNITLLIPGMDTGERDATDVSTEIRKMLLIRGTYNIRTNRSIRLLVTFDDGIFRKRRVQRHAFRGECNSIPCGCVGFCPVMNKIHVDIISGRGSQ